jgi:hypothetical protein
MNLTPLKKDSIETEEKFETDTQTIIRRHLEDKDHVITEDEIRNVRIGMDADDEEKPQQADTA